MSEVQKHLAEAIRASDAKRGRITSPEKALEDAAKVIEALAREGHAFVKVPPPSGAG